MIKIFLLSLFLFACKPEVKYQDLSVPVDKTNLEIFKVLSFNPQIEMMIMFLWPRDLGPKNEKEVVEIISTSRKIAEDKEKYLKNLFMLNSEYSKLNCDCHSFGICEDGVEMDDDILLECDDISNKQETNNMILANLTLDYELIKEKLNTIGAINIDVGVDDDLLDIGTYDMQTKSLKLNKFGYMGQANPIEFIVRPYKAQNMKAKFIFMSGQEIFTGDIGVTNKKHNVIFSGEIETDTGLRGLIYWEHLK